MPADSSTMLLHPVLQFGAFGLCLLLIALLWWLLRRLLDVISANTKALEGLTGLIVDVKSTSQDIRDRLLAWGGGSYGDFDPQKKGRSR